MSPKSPKRKSTGDLERSREAWEWRELFLARVANGEPVDQAEAAVDRAFAVLQRRLVKSGRYLTLLPRPTLVPRPTSSGTS